MIHYEYYKPCYSTNVGQRRLGVFTRVTVNQAWRIKDFRLELGLGLDVCGIGIRIYYGCVSGGFEIVAVSVETRK